jgi:hypothetical protein
MTFITGSWMYGSPRPDSDIDLVLPPMDTHPTLGRPAMYQQLISNSDNAAQPIKYGKLNLILCSTQKQYDLWKQGTIELRSRSIVFGPIARQAAIDHFDALFESHGLSKSTSDSGEYKE